MATTTIYTVESTDGVVTLVIQPRTFNGADGILRNTDLTLYGNATPNWGERFNENFYRVTENFATEQASAAVPMGEEDLGEEGWGINAPLQGQLWYNKTDDHLYLQTVPTLDLDTLPPIWEMLPTMDDVNDTITDALDALNIGDIADGLDGKVNRSGDTMTGNLVIEHIDATHPVLTINTNHAQDPWVALAENGQNRGLFALDASPDDIVVYRRYEPAGSINYTQLAIREDYFRFETSGGFPGSQNQAKVRCPSTLAGDVDTTMTTKDYVDAAVAAVSGGGGGGGVEDHGLLTGLSGDDHPQYHNNARGDVRYYTKASLDGGQLDNRYYTEAEVNALIAAVGGGGGGTNAGDIGTYALAHNQNTYTSANWGTTLAGSDLEVANANGDSNAAGFPGTSFSGTWRCMGWSQSFGTNAQHTTVWVRIS